MRILLSLIVACTIMCASNAYSQNGKEIKIQSQSVISSTGEITYDGYKKIENYISDWSGRHGFKKFIQISFQVITGTKPPSDSPLDNVKQIKNQSTLEKLIVLMSQEDALEKLETARILVQDATSIVDSIQDEETKKIVMDAVEALNKVKTKQEEPIDVFDDIISATEPLK